MTYCTLSQVHDEIVLSSSNTNYDTELTNLISLVDSEINTILQKYTSMPLQLEIQTQFAYIEARMVATHFRLKRATPQEKEQLQSVLKENQALLMGIINSNFKSSFGATSPRDDEYVWPAVIPWGFHSEEGY